MSDDLIHPIEPDTFHPPRFPLEPPHEYIRPSWLQTAPYSMVQHTTEQGFPDINEYISQSKAIDIFHARTAIEIHAFQRINTIAALGAIAGLSALTQWRMTECFHSKIDNIHAINQMAGRNDICYDAKRHFWVLFQCMYQRDMKFLFYKVKQHCHEVVAGINWEFLALELCTDVSVMIYLWMLAVWHRYKELCESDEQILKILADHLCTLIPSLPVVQIDEV